jgi:hypothetical protein
MGLYNYDETIFDDMALPSTDHLNKDTLIQNILVECSELEILYTDPTVFKMIVKYWSEARVHVWQKLADTMDYEYNPIWNKDVKDTEYIKRTKDESTTYADQASSTTSGTNTNKGVAYNTNELENREQDQTSGSMSSTDNSTTRDAGYNDEDREYISQGNQGITSTQQLIKEEREVSLFSLYDIIISEFKTRFCLLVY